jgi:hypothetical protein
MPPRGSMPRSSFAIAMKDYTFIRPGIAVSISAAVIVISLIIGFKLIVDLGQNRASIERAGHTVRTLHRYSAAAEVWRQMAEGGDPELQRPEARALRDSIQRSLTGELSELRNTLADSSDRGLVDQIIAGFSARADLTRESREAMILLLAHQDNAIFEAAEASQRAVLLAAILLGLSILAAGLLVVPMAWLYIRYKRGAVIDVKV